MKKFVVLGLVCLFAVFALGCPLDKEPTTAGDSDVKKVNIEVQTQASGKTIEQENIVNRYKLDNKPGSIKHLYIISAYSGQVILYSTVRGKVTSSGKRLTPYKVLNDYGASRDGFPVYFGGSKYTTDEVLQDDGTYGHSIPYLFWWDSKGIYHHHYVSGGQIIHISDAPLGGVKSIIINVETQ